MKSVVGNLKDKERQSSTGSIKERQSSTGSIKEYKKRKRELLGNGEEVKKNIFKRTEKSPPRAGDKGRLRCLRSGGRR